MVDKPIKKAAAYAWMVPYIAEVSHKYGYAIGLHGSINRDLDLMSMPWTDQAVEPDVLIEHIREAVSGKVLPTGTPAARWDHEQQTFVPTTIKNPDYKPHGRLAYNIHLDGGLFIDISVMPLQHTGTEYVQ